MLNLIQIHLRTHRFFLLAWLIPLVLLAAASPDTYIKSYPDEGSLAAVGASMRGTLGPVVLSPTVLDYPRLLPTRTHHRGDVAQALAQSSSGLNYHQHHPKPDPVTHPRYVSPLIDRRYSGQDGESKWHHLNEQSY